MKKLYQKICAHKYLIAGYLLIGLVLLLTPDISFAAEKSATQELNENLSAFFKWILGVIFPLVWLVVGFVGSLMDNSFILTPEVETMLRGAWQNVRNFVNIIFVIVLLIIAIYNILGRSEGNFVLKTVLPKFVIALIAVNFSFFIGKFMLDINNIATAAVMSVPASVLKSQNISEITCYEQAKDEDDVQELESRGGKGDGVGTWYSVACALPRYIYVSLNETLVTKDEKSQNNKETEYKVNEQLVRFSTEKITLSPTMFNQNTFALILAYNVFGIQRLVDVAEGSTDLSKLTINAFFAIMFLIIYGAIFVAIALVLIGRAAVIWISLALAPLAAVFYVLEGLFQAPEGLDLKQKFFKHVFAPLMLAVPISLSFLLINAAIKFELIDYSKDAKGQGAFHTTNPDDSSKGITVTVNSSGAAKGLDDARSILWYISIVVLLWTGVKAAASGNIVEGAVNTVLDKVKDAGKFVGQLPAYLPIIPITGTKRISLYGIKEIVGDSLRRIKQSAQNQAAENDPFDKGKKDKVKTLHAIQSAATPGKTQDLHDALGHALNKRYYLQDMPKETVAAIATIKNNSKKVAYIKGLKGIFRSNDKYTTADDLIEKVYEDEEDAKQRMTELLSGRNGNDFFDFIEKSGIQSKSNSAIAGEEAEAPKTSTVETRGQSPLAHAGNKDALEKFKDDTSASPGDKRAATILAKLSLTSDAEKNIHLIGPSENDSTESFLKMMNVTDQTTDPDPNIEKGVTGLLNAILDPKKSAAEIVTAIESNEPFKKHITGNGAKGIFDRVIDNVPGVKPKMEELRNKNPVYYNALTGQK